MPNNKFLKFFLKLIVSLAFIAWLVFKIDWKETFFYFQRISLWQIVLYVIVLLAGMTISAYKWKILAEFRGFKIALKHCFQLYLAGTFINNFMPSFIGGDAYRTYQLGKSEKKYVSAAASVVVDRTTGLLGAMILSVAFAGFNWRIMANHGVLIAIIGIIAVLLAVAATAGIIMKFSFWRKMSRFFPKKILEIVKDFAEYKNSRGVIMEALLLSIAFNLIGVGAANYVLFSGLGINIGIWDYISVIFLISIISAIPVSINNIGVKEWAYVTFFGFFDISSAAVIAVALLSRAIQMIVSFAAVPFYLKNKK